MLAVIREIIPFPALQSANSYIDYHEKQANAAAIKELEAGAEQAALESVKELLAHAVRYESAENDRGNSITARAQALLVAQTFFGALLAFSTAMVGRSDLVGGWLSSALTALLAYTLLLVIFLTLNAIRATSGLRYRRIGTSDLAKWVPGPDSGFVRNLALGTLANYRQAAIVNTWRSLHLSYAQACLRNVVFALSILIALVVYVAVKGAWMTHFSGAPG